VWAYESQMDMIAERLALDPVEFRRRNLLRNGDSFVTGETLCDMHYDELLDSAVNAIDWPADARAKRGSPNGVLRRGKGVALVIKATITPSTSAAALKMNEDGSLNVLVSSVELGQGSQTVLAQIAAQAMELPLPAVSVSNPDTDLTPYDQQTSSSRTTFSVGGAVRTAAQDLREQLVSYAANLLEARSTDLVPAQGRVAVRGSPTRSLTYGDIVLRSNQGTLIGRGAFATRGGLDLETGQGIGSVHWHQGAVSCEVEVDTETGRIRLLQLNPCVFAGKVVNPRLSELQLEGSAIFGFGQALLEEMVYDSQGQLLNRNLGEYSVPSFADIPLKLRAVALEDTGSGDLHGIGETLLPPVMAAIGNAVFNAIGVRIRDLPLTPEKVLRALADK
jgi:CO/xanthine dehydrogenase Mo-binding subunit